MSGGGSQAGLNQLGLMTSSLFTATPPSTPLAKAEARSRAATSGAGARAVLLPVALWGAFQLTSANYVERYGLHPASAGL